MRLHCASWGVTLSAWAVLGMAMPGSVRPQAAVASRAVGDASLASVMARLSEQGGYFDSDNLISNETSYLHVVPRLAALGVRGGAYIGVGPDQNYSYLAAIRPQIAFMLDIRRDNALQHLLYKALFARARNRFEYLCRWLGRPVPADVARWTDRSIDEIVAYVDSTRLDAVAAERERRATLAQVERIGVPLDSTDRATVLRFHRAFMRDGLDVRFESFGRNNARDYPTFRSLILDRVPPGERYNYLVREGDWAFVKGMHAADRIIPVVGDLAGSRAFPAIAQELRARGIPLSALYTSNAEMYVFRSGGFETFARTVARLPIADHAVIIRSYFQRGGSHPLAVPGHASTQLLQRIADFNARFRSGQLTTYWSIVALDAR